MYSLLCHMGYYKPLRMQGNGFQGESDAIDYCLQLYWEALHAV